jgi:hypothetical protein
MLRQLVTPEQQQVSLAAAWVGRKQQAVGAHANDKARISAYAPFTSAGSSAQGLCLLTVFAALLPVQVWPFYTFLLKACSML